MRDDEFEAWLPRMRDDYARDMAENGGLEPDRAAKTSAEQVEALFPGLRPSDEQLVLVIEADGEPVGNLWLAERRDALTPCLYVYEVYVDEAYRGRGYGRAAMVFAEEEARRRGLDRVSLNVFGGNAVARGLYRSLGYAENAVSMSKGV
jgi:ribosomal protein S18 acetylase RimI-like enzyme